MSSFYIKQGDTSPSIQITAKDSSGSAIDLTGSSVRFHMYSQDKATSVVDAAATLVTPGSGIVKYDWQTADTEDFGVYLAEFEVTYADSAIETFPNDDYITIIITRELA